LENWIDQRFLGFNIGIWQLASGNWLSVNRKQPIASCHPQNFKDLKLNE